MNQYTSFRKKQGEEIVFQTKTLMHLNDSLLFQKQLKDTLISNEEDQKLKIEVDKKGQQKLISQIKRKEGSYKKELRKKLDEEKKIVERIDKIIKDAIAKSNVKTGVKKAKGFALTPETKALATRFEQNKGKLPWPVDRGLIVRRFGRQSHPTFSGIMIQSPGLHIVTSKGGKADCIFNGEVFSVLTLGEGKKSIMVRHGNYITAYNNLEKVYVKIGDKVKTGQSLGQIFTDKITGKTTLIFVLFKDSKRLNPASWISKR